MIFIFWIIIFFLIFYKFSNFWAKLWLAYFEPLLGKVSKKAEDVINNNSKQAGTKISDDQVEEVRK
jgi:hypothetical protein